MSSLLVYLSTPSSGGSPSWSRLHVPPSCHEIKPFLALLRAELKVADEYGFKLSISEGDYSPSSAASPLNDPSLKPITSVSEFQGLFETLEWSDGSGIILVVELKKKDPAAVAAAAAASTSASSMSASNKFQAPTLANAKPIVQTPAYVPVQAHNVQTTPTSTAAPTIKPLGSQLSNGGVVGERNPNYRSPFTASASTTSTAPSSYSPSAASSSSASNSDEPATRSVTDKLAMFGGASMAVSSRKYNSGNNASTNSGSNSSQPSWMKPPASNNTSSPTPNPPSSVPASSPSSQLSTAPLKPSPTPLTASVVKLTPVTPVSTAPLTASLATLKVSAPPAPSVAPVALNDPDLDLPPPPEGFADPFANSQPPPPPPSASTSSIAHPPLPPPPPPASSSANPPLPPPPAASSAPVLQVAKVFTIGDPDLPQPPPPSSSDASQPPLPPPPPAAAASPFQPHHPPSAATLAPLSAFLAQLKPSHASLTFFYAQDRFREMCDLARNQIRLYEDEVVSGRLASGSIEKQQASNGLLIYLFHLSLGHTSLGEHQEAIQVSRRFVEQYEALPPVLQADINNMNMYIQLLHNTGLTLERSGDVQGAITNLTAAANMIDRTANGTSDPSAALAPTLVKLDHRSDIYSALGNLYTACKQFPLGTDWHHRAVSVENSKPRSDRKWTIYHAAASCLAQQGKFEEAIQNDTEAISFFADPSSSASTQQPNPRIFFNRGLCYQRLAEPNWEASIADFTRVLMIDERTFPKAYVLRAKALLRQQEWSRVVEDCQAALKLTPTDAQAREFMTFAQQQLEQQ